MDTKKYLDYEGLKHLWSKIQSKTELTYEMLNLELTSNQEREITTVITVTSNDEFTEYPYNNELITLKLEGGKTYNISFGDIKNHKTPPPVTFTAIAGNARTISQQYKASKLTFNVTGLTDVNDSTITVSGNNTDTYTLKHGESALVPHDTQISISVNDVDGYTTPLFEKSIYNSDQTINVIYNKVHPGMHVLLQVGGGGTSNNNSFKLVSIDTIKSNPNILSDGLVLAVGFIYPDGTNTFIPAGEQGYMWFVEDHETNNICKLSHCILGSEQDFDVSLQSSEEAITGEYNQSVLDNRYGNALMTYSAIFPDVDEAGKTVSGIPAINYVKEKYPTIIHGRANCHVPSPLELMLFFDNYEDYIFCCSYLGSNWFDFKNGIKPGINMVPGAGDAIVIFDDAILYNTCCIYNKTGVRMLEYNINKKTYQLSNISSMPAWTVPLCSIPIEDIFQITII